MTDPCSVDPETETEASKSAMTSSTTAANVPANYIWCRCRLWAERCLGWAESFTSGRWWHLKAAILCVAFSILVMGGFRIQPFMECYNEKIEHPLKDLTRYYPLDSHEAKLNYRLTVPVILHLLRLHSQWVMPAATILAITAVLYLSCLVAFQITSSRVVALFVGLGVASTYAGSYGFIQVGYDAMTLALVVCAALVRIPWYLRGILVFAACFADERGGSWRPCSSSRFVASPRQTARGGGAPG